MKPTQTLAILVVCLIMQASSASTRVKPTPKRRTDLRCKMLSKMGLPLGMRRIACGDVYHSKGRRTEEVIPQEEREDIGRTVNQRAVDSSQRGNILLSQFAELLADRYSSPRNAGQTRRDLTWSNYQDTPSRDESEVVKDSAPDHYYDDGPMYLIKKWYDSLAGSD